MSSRTCFLLSCLLADLQLSMRRIVDIHIANVYGLKHLSPLPLLVSF